MKPLTISSDEHILLVGATGTGKSTLAEKLMRSRKRLLIYDFKAELEWSNVEPLTDFAMRNIIERPARLITSDETKFIEACEKAFELGNITVYIDEIYGLNEGKQVIDYRIKRILQMGRSRNVAMCACSQRPMLIPLFFITEAKHFFIFRLNLDEDRQRIAKLSTAQVRLPVKDKYGYLYYNVDESRLIYDNGKGHK